MSRRMLLSGLLVLVCSVGLLAYVLELERQLGLASENRCPIGAVCTCPQWPGAERHDTEHWVCETEDKWAKDMLDANDCEGALDEFQNIIGEQEQDLAYWRGRCDPAKQDPQAIVENTDAIRDWLRMNAARQALRRREEKHE